LIERATRISEDQYVNEYCSSAFRRLDFNDGDTAYKWREYKDHPKKFLLDCYKAMNKIIAESGGYDNYIKLIKSANELGE